MRQLFRIALSAATALAAVQPGFAQTDNETIVQGYVRFMAYHEAGHLLMNQIQNINAANTPGEINESDADDFAAILLAPDADDPNGRAEMIGAARAWLRAGPRYSATDPHAPPEERAEQIVCNIYGSDPAAFAALEDIIRPEWECEAAFKMMSENLMRNYVNPTDARGAPITVTYRSATPGLEQAQQFLKDSRILEDLSTDIGEFFKLTRPTKIIAMSCEKEGAVSGTFHYDPPSSTKPEDNYDQISICYELIANWLKVDFNDG